MLDVFFTVDVEIWCNGSNQDARFPQAFQQYVYGHTPTGEYGLRYKVKQLEEHGLSGVFFVESLFTTRFGKDPLAEIVGLIQEHHQEVQLHLHTEWAHQAIDALTDRARGNRQFLQDFSLAEQTILIAAGKKILEQASGHTVNAFRAGNFGFNRDSLRALAANGITFDSSYNATMFGLTSGVMPGHTLLEPIECEGVYEYPMTVFDGGTRSLRHAQLGACSYREMEGLLWQALHSGRKAFVILSHNFELMNMARDRPDPVVVTRFRKLCQFLDRNRDCFRMRGFQDLKPAIVHSQPAPLTSPVWKTGLRMLEQGMRRRYG
jgi:peptidoglycan/xylan/chitin deacetylase (PgdA/CDA1 family)